MPFILWSFNNLNQKPEDWNNLKGTWSEEANTRGINPKWPSKVDYKWKQISKVVMRIYTIFINGNDNILIKRNS